MLRGEFLNYHASITINPKPKLDLEAITDEYSLFREAFSKTNGIVIGEEHFDNVSAGFLVDNMEYLVSLGVDTLFFEGLFYGLERGADGLRDERESVHPEYSRLMEAAKTHGLKIVGIDSKGCKRGDGITRDIFMNAHAAAIINASDAKKWIALVGMMHLESCHFIDSVTTQKHIVHGLAGLTEAYSIILHALQEDEQKYINNRTKFFAWPAKRITPNFLVGIHAHKNISDIYRGVEITNPVEELYQSIKHQGWQISHYDIDSYAKYIAEVGYIKGIVFALSNSNLEEEALAKITCAFETTLNSSSDNSNSWINITSDGCEIIFFCDLNNIEFAVKLAEESMQLITSPEII